MRTLFVKPAVTVALIAVMTCACASISASFSSKAEDFAQEMAAKHNLDRQQTSDLMAGAVFQQEIIDAISRPYEAKPWHQYRPIFVTDSRTKAGVDFWHENRALLQRAEQEYGVPPEIIVAIIGVETFYGKHRGRYRVLDSLSTLAFGYPPRGKFFRRQLEEFLLLNREEPMAVDEIVGSYAGAMGMPQFIPQSYRSYAVDFDNDGKRDLLESRADIIGSVANYFKRHGWQAGKMVAVPAKATGSKYQPYANFERKLNASVGELKNAGVSSEEPLPAELQTALIELESSPDEQEHWLGFHNFYVITKYNHSILYAMAVHQLSQQILQLYKQQRAGNDG
jgi:membrane-bound lytic murein transglycosylase B